MRKFLQNKPLAIAAAALLVLLVLAAVSGGDRTVTFVESAAGSVLQPVQSFASRASDSIIGFFRNLFSTTDADIENQQLKAELSQMQQALNEMETIRTENERLKELLAFADSTPELSYVSGMVIGHSQSIWFDTFTINVGRNHGVEKNMPVVTTGLVGRVTQVGATWSKVVAIIDPNMSVSVMVERTRDSGMVRGMLQTGNSVDTLEMYYLSVDGDLVPGDKIVTSGIGGIYPKGIPVGTVTEVSRSGESESNAFVQPTADFRHIEEVMVVVGMPSSGDTE
ncbi:rod shape-determining protein MreC [Christensenellaceae bacterium OttesenSCG-928-L17]|nr:rod shape-determining protein MreC [Christensenellaceae bacterium OttesenSCG-928-L17]